MTLEELRQYFQNDQQAFNALQEKAIKRDEEAMKSEIDNLQKEKQLERLQHNKNDQELTELMKVLESQKEKELRAKIEREKIMAELQGIDRNKLTYIEEDKKNELKRLAQERENLKQREDAIMNEIGNLQTKIKQREDNLFKEKEELALKGKSKELELKEEIRKKEIEYAKERGETVAEIKQRRALLEQERERITKDLEAVKRGDIDVVKRIANKETLLVPKVDGEISGLDPEKKQMLLENKARIEQLKESIKKTNAELMPEIDEFDTMNQQFKDKDTKKMTLEYISQIEDQNKDDPKKLIQDLGNIRSHLERASVPSLGAVQKSPGAPLKDRDMRNSMAGSVKQIPGFFRQEVVIKPPPMKMSIYNKPAPQPKYQPVEEQMPSRTPQPAPAAAPQAQSQAYPYPQYPPPPPPWASAYQQPPPQQQAPIDPFLLQNLSDIKQTIGKTMEANEKLESELQQLKEQGTKTVAPTNQPNPTPAPKTAAPKKDIINLPRPQGISQ